MTKTDTWTVPQQAAAYGILSIVVIALTLAQRTASSPYFQRFFGAANPLLVIVAAIFAGGVGLGLLYRLGGFQVMQGQATLRGLALSFGIATMLAAAIIVADLIFRYPEEINAPMPVALVFYPAIGFVAEIVFHVVPLALAVAVLTPFRRRLGRQRMVWSAIVLVAVSEPIFQVVFGEEAISARAAYTAVHVFAFALLQLAVFRRFDFMSMYAMRLFYYAYWHVIWGVLRLELLF